MITVVDGIAVIGQGVLAVFLHVGRAVLVGVIAPAGINFIVGSQGELVNGIRAVLIGSAVDFSVLLSAPADEDDHGAIFSRLVSRFVGGVQLIVFRFIRAYFLLPRPAETAIGIVGQGVGLRRIGAGFHILGIHGDADGGHQGNAVRVRDALRQRERAVQGEGLRLCLAGIIACVLSIPRNISLHIALRGLNRHLRWKPHLLNGGAVFHGDCRRRYDIDQVGLFRGFRHIRLLVAISIIAPYGVDRQSRAVDVNPARQQRDLLKRFLILLAIDLAGFRSGPADEYNGCFVDGGVGWRLAA